MFSLRSWLRIPPISSGIKRRAIAQLATAKKMVKSEAPCIERVASRLEDPIQKKTREASSINDKSNYWYAQPVQFRMSDDFVKSFSTVKPPFGFNGLGELVFKRTYARPKANNVHEEWFETVERVVEGVFTLRKQWLVSQHLPLDESRETLLAENMYRRIFHMKFLPPGRGLWAMGSPLTRERYLFAALNNCAFVSTKDMFTAGNPSEPFVFLMDAAMLGVGVGFDTLGAQGPESNRIVKGVNKSLNCREFVIPDSREGWVESVALLIDSYFKRTQPVKFNYDDIRPMGLPIKGFGGIASGPGPLIKLHEQIDTILSEMVGKPITVTVIVDIMNLIGKCVIAGNVRRTAEIAFGDPNSQEYIDLKNYKVNPQRMDYGWTSNNSVFAKLGMDYSSVCDRVKLNGEPGFVWMENAKAFSRMNGPADHKDSRAMGGNPCLEQTLESYEMCCLVETFPNKHESLDDFLETLSCAFLYAKTVTLAPTHWARTNQVMMRNRRIGTSMSGLAQFITKHGVHTLKEWCDQGYNFLKDFDQQISEEYSIPTSIKITSIKPSGTVSLLAGATPGMHYPESRFCIRRVRLAKESPLVKPLVDAGFPVEPCVGSENDTVVVEFPIDMGENVRSLTQVSMWEQLSLCALLQKYWADNQVSCTITFDPENESQHLAHALDYFQYQLKGISFLPRLSYGAYPQMPFEAINEKEYNRRNNCINDHKFLNNLSTLRHHDKMYDNYCSGDTCLLKSETNK